MRQVCDMVLISVIVLAVTAAGTAFGEEPTAIYRGSSRAVKFDVSPQLRNIAPLPITKPARNLIEPDSGRGGEFGPQDVDPLVQEWAPTEAIPSPLISFNGPPNLAGVSPPDPVGDVGPNHYVAMSNLYFQIYDKAGTSVYGPAANNTLWAGFGGDCQSDNDGDPIVLYDQLADRWILTQFTASGPTYFNCVAISTSPDPTGTYYRYAFTTGTNFPDYPKYGVWPDAYYISTREFAGSFVGVGAYAVNRAEMIAGNPAPTMISFLVPPGATPYNVGDGLLPTDLDGFTQPPAGSPNYYLGTMDQGAQYGAPQDAINLWKFHADFATPANSTFTLANTIPTAAFDSVFPCSPGSRDCIPQPGTTTKIDILSYRQRPMHRAAYRNFGTHESLVTSQSVEATPGMAGVRWYELRDPDGTPTIHQQGTYAPADGIHRWMGSIAMDEAGNIALGYSASDGTSTFPSVWYSGRLSGDPLGTLPQGEGSFVDGTGSQTGSGRWGDYTSMNIDPVDDCTFWYVNEWIPTTSSVGWQLRIGAFKFDACGTPDFFLGGNPDSVDICTGSDAVYDITVGSISGFSNAVTLAASGNPAGTTTGFTANPVTPPGSSTFTVGNTGSATAGSYVVTVSGTATGSPGHGLDLNLNVFDMAPDAPVLTLPVNGALNQPLQPTFEWTAATQAASYTLEVDDDPGFGSPDVVVAGITDTFVTLSTDLMSSTVYYWRVSAVNVCGTGPASASFTLTTVALPGDCGIGTVAVVPFFEDFETGAAGWTSGGTGDTWTLSGARVHSGAFSYFAVDTAAISDQQLQSPDIMLPTDTPLTFQFWNWQEIENSSGGCFDGGMLEISTDAGASWTQLPTTVMQTDPYDGPISTSFSNPLGGLDAWCGDPQDWLRSVVDLDAYAGQTARFRFRIGTDSSVGHEGWYIDDVAVQACVPVGGPIFVDGFESGDTTAWSSSVP